MCRLFETIRIINGVIQNLPLHEERMNHTRRELFGKSDLVRLSDHIVVPAGSSIGVVRCRVIYGPEILSIEFSPYVAADVKTLRKVEADSIIYNHKFLDRNQLTSLIDKSIADDILIIKDGCVTDSSYANIVFTDGMRWITPDTPLLRGTMRDLLIQKEVIIEKRIKVNDLPLFTHFRLINAMLGFGYPIQPISNIL